MRKRSHWTYMGHTATYVMSMHNTKKKQIKTNKKTKKTKFCLFRESILIPKISLSKGTSELWLRTSILKSRNTAVYLYFCMFLAAAPLYARRVVAVYAASTLLIELRVKWARTVHLERRRRWWNAFCSAVTRDCRLTDLIEFLRVFAPTWTETVFSMWK